MTRDEVLRTAMEYVTKDRNKTHGEPEELFNHIAASWSVLLTQITGNKVVLTANHVALMMVAFKVVRSVSNPGNEDNWIDIAGYAACGAECNKVD